MRKGAVPFMAETEIQNCITCFTENLHSILGDKLLSVYLYGSVTLGDYKDGWSDIDLIGFTTEPASPSEAEKLLMLRQSLVDSENEPLFRKIEGAVVSFDEFSEKRYTRLVYWGTSGQRITDRFAFDVFSMFELMRYGQLIFGADIRDRLALPSYSELASGVRGHYEVIRKFARETDESLYSCGWLLDIARCLYTLRSGDIIGKTQAGEWALKENLCPCKEELIKTLAVRNDPLAYIALPETKTWLRSLGPAVQLFADILEKELERL